MAMPEFLELPSCVVEPRFYGSFGNIQGGADLGNAELFEIVEADHDLFLYFQFL